MASGSAATVMVVLSPFCGPESTSTGKAAPAFEEPPSGSFCAPSRAQAVSTRRLMMVSTRAAGLRRWYGITILRFLRRTKVVGPQRRQDRPLLHEPSFVRGSVRGHGPGDLARPTRRSV